MSFLFTILAIGFVIFIHELGHLFAAKKAKVGVSEFSVGMGPKIFSFNLNETMYSLRILPFGGFIKAKGLDDMDDCPIEEDFREKSLLARSSIIVAGSFMNLVLGFVIFTLVGFFVGNVAVNSTIGMVKDSYPAAEIGIMKGDKIIKINNDLITDVKTDVIDFIKSSEGHPFSLTYRRGDLDTTVMITPKLMGETSYVIGVIFGFDKVSLGPIGAISHGLNKTMFTIGQTFIGLKMLISGSASIKDLAGPVGIVQLASSQYQQNLAAFFGLIAFISISLGIINLFPFPVLDGGHLVFLAIEGIFGRPVNKKVEILVNNTAAVCLIGLMVFIVFNDVINWSDRVELIKEMNK